MYGTKRLFLESEPGKKDFQGMTMEHGEFLMFNGNKCVHYNQVNTEPELRISLDFRTIPRTDYINYFSTGNITTTNPRDVEKLRKPVKMIAGGYYQICRKSDSLADMFEWHMQRDMLLQTRPNFDICEANACFNYMKDGVNFVTEYQQTTLLEDMLSKFIGVKHVLMTTSGSMALALALMGCGIGPGDDVIVPDFTMIATINAVKMVGATPVVVDVDPTTYTLSRDIIERSRTPSTKCVLFVSLNNRQVDLDDITSYCNSQGICLIEDAAQSLGATVNGKHFGTFGRVGCFSLSTPKIISTGQGGFVVTDDDSIASKMSMIKNFGRKTGGVDNFEMFGLNLKFTDIQAVIGIEQMKKLPERVVFMRNLYQLYFSEIQGIPSVRMIPQSETYVPWFVDIYTERRDELAEFLKKHNIQTRPTYPAIHTTSMYECIGEFPNATYVSSNGLFLPSHTLLTDGEVRHICKLIGCFFGKNLKYI
jgi:perosamine synthetase